MVSPSYLLHKPSLSSAPMTFFDQRVVPALIDAAGGVEGLLGRLASRTRSAPGFALGAAFGAGSFLAMLTMSRRR